MYRTLLTITVTLLTAISAKLKCGPNDEIHLTRDWSLPLSDLEQRQRCTYNFYAPDGYFPVMSIFGQQMKTAVRGCSTGGLCYDLILVQSDYAFRIATNTSADVPTFNSSNVWPPTFSLTIGTGDNTTMQLQIDIVLQKSTVGQNLVRTITTDMNAPSTLIYSDDFREGQTYTIQSKRKKVCLASALAYSGMINLLTNIFIYENGALTSTLSQPYHASRGSQIQMYVAQTPVGLTDAAVVFTDCSNLPATTYSFDDHAFIASFVPLAAPDQTVTLQVSGGGGSTPGTMTIIERRDGSTPFDVRQISSVGAGNFSYALGGPTASQLQSTKLDPRTLPVHLTGIMNTFYGEGTMKITVD